MFQPVKFDRYKVELTFIRDVLATNPSDPNVLDTHILDRQRKLITEKGGVNSQINKYLDAIPISKEKGDEEVNRLFEKLENLLGYKLEAEDREKALRGELESLKETLQEVELKGTTVFFWDKEKNLPCIGDHMILGFLKAAAEAIGRTLQTAKKEKEKDAAPTRGKVMHSISYTQSLINQHVRVQEQFITFDKDVVRGPDGKSVIYLQRSLRAITAQGPRVSLAKSEKVPAGAKISFTLKVLENSAVTHDVLNALLSYGELSGIGQWRNVGHGEFTHKIEKIN